MTKIARWLAVWLAAISLSVGHSHDIWPIIIGVLVGFSSAWVGIRIEEYLRVRKAERR